MLADDETNCYEKWLDQENNGAMGCFEFEMSVLHIARKTAEFLAECSGPATVAASGKHLTEKISGLDLSAIHGDEKAYSLLGKTPEHICEAIAINFRILHIESVIRNDLYRYFFAQRQKLGEELMQVPMRRSASEEDRHLLRTKNGEKEYLAGILLNPRLTFNGTRRDLLPSIVRHDFLLPGDPVPQWRKDLGSVRKHLWRRHIF